MSKEMQYPKCKCGEIMERCFIWAYGMEQSFYMCPKCHRSMTDEERQAWVRKGIWGETR